MSAAYDVFLSYAWADGDRPHKIAEALSKAGLRVWLDAAEINDFTSITRAVAEGLAQSKALLAYYSKTYPLRRACQWELTAAFLAAQAEGDPRRRVLVVNPEEKTDHIHPIELSDAKFRTAPIDEGRALHELVQSVVKHVAVIDGPLADIHPLSAPTWHGMAPVGSTRFVGRLKQMWEVHSLLHANDVPQVTYEPAATGGIARVSGLGGVGKSLLAEEYALHFGSAYPGGVFWLRAYGNDDVQTTPLRPEQREAMRTDQLRRMAERLSIYTHGMTDEQVEGTLAGKIASGGKPCLWVVDDVPNGLDGEALRRWFAPNALARTLITTRSGEYGSLTKGIDLSVLERDEAYQLLTSRRVPLDGDEEEQARLLTEDLGYHALALDVTGSALFSSVAAKPFGDFRAKLARPDKDALELAERLAEALPNGHEKSIAQTMLRSLSRLGEEGQDFTRLASVLAVAPIPASLVTAVFEEADKLSWEEAEEHASLAFKQVTSASLAEIAGETQDARSVHTLVSRTVRFQEKGSPERTEVLRAAAIVALQAAIPAAAGDWRLQRQVELQVAHAWQVVSNPATADEVALVSCVAGYEFVRGAYASARALYERELDFCRRVQGAEHPHTLSSMDNLAATLRALADFEEARRLLEEALYICRRVQGPEHPNTLSLMINLATTLRKLGDLAGARKLQEETIAVLLRVRGPVLRDMVAAMSGLAEEETIAVLLRVREPEQLRDMVAAMSGLAETLFAQGDLAGARKLQEEKLDILGGIFGREHPDTLYSMSNLALTLFKQDDLAGARTLQEEILDIGRKLLGPEHPETLTWMNNLAATLFAQDDLAGARRLLEETLAIRRRVQGPEHPDTSSAAWNLFRALHDLGELEAELAVLKSDLLWLLDRDPATLGADQRTVRLKIRHVSEHRTEP
jgi:tetratricopeptide (TPR) repeat protein